MNLKKLSVGLSVMVIINSGAPTLKIFADEITNNKIKVETTKISKSNMEEMKNNKDELINAIINPFIAYDNLNYNEIYKMDNFNIESIKNNAGNNMGKPISYATDGDINTAWESNKVNSDNFTNEVEVTFKENVVLDRVIYGARQNDSKGFAQEFEIYGSKTTNNDSYELIASGKSEVVKGLIEAKFEPTEFKKMKFKFKKGKDNWATISEIGFYKEDQLLNKVHRLFTDNTLSEVSEEFSTMEKLEILEEQFKLHPLYNTYKEKIEDAKIILENEKLNSSIAQTGQFKLYENEAYNELFKINKSNIQSIANNAGHYSSQVITNAIDGNVNTYWETNKSNNENFNNEVEITFKDKVILNRIVYGARQSDTKGFAEEFEIYASKTSNGDTYQLVATGKHDREKGLVEAKFDPTEFKRVKFKFKKSNQNWATLNEILFYKEDKLNETLNNLFKDKTMTELKDEFNSREVIDDLANQVNSHPDKVNLKILIDRAYNVLNNNLNKENVKIILPQIGDIHGHAKRNLLMNSFGTNFITTGIVASPGETIEVYVDADKNQPLPQVVFSQSQGHYGKWRKNYQLKPGYNRFEVPEIYDSNWSHKTNKGGAIYLLNPYTSEEQGKAPVVSIEGGRKFPVFNQGDNKDEFLQELKEYKKYMDENPDTAVDIFEYNSPRILFTGTASDAYQVYVNEGIDIDTSIRVWSEFTEEGFKFAGLEDNPQNPTHDSTNVRTTIRVMQPYGAAYAAGDHVGIQKHVADDFLRIDKKSINGIIWGTMHEIGHQMDIPARTWGEVTNNMWANEMAILNEKGCRLNYQKIYDSVGLNHSLDKLEFEKLSESLGMFWQLELYKDGYWAQIERMYRERRPNPKDYQDKKDIFAKYSSEVVGKNLTEYFERYGFSLSDDCKDELNKLPKLNDKIWYIHSDIMKYEGNGFNEDIKIKVNSKIDEQNRANMLTFEIDKDNKDNLLGYEISKDGEVIGFTRNSSFKVENIDINENANYTVVPYDIKLNKVDAISVKAFTPNIKLNEKITLKLNETFNPKDYAKAYNYKGEKIESIQVSHNVDTTKKGTYNVEYKVVDSGVDVVKNMAVEVVSEYDYLSDFEWRSVQTQYGNARKNENIRARVNGEIKEFEKGFGIHANGEITYDLSDKEYDNFEAMLGVDMTIAAQDRSSITFKVSVDGEAVATTKVLKYVDDAVYINVPIKGAKELKIEVYDGGNGNSSDHSVIVNPKLTYNNAKPKLEIEKSSTIKVGEDVKDIIGNYKAIDAEDGDITSNVVVSGHEDINFNKPGKYTIKYTVTDSDNNTTTKERAVSVIDMRDYKYLTYYDWKSASQSYSTTNKNLSVSGKSLRLTNENNEEVRYEKGIGAHANATIIYDLSDKNYEYFTSFVGVDREMYNRPGSVSFEVHVDGEKKFDSGLMLAKDPQKFIEVNISGAKELKLIVKDGGNGIGSDHASWGDTKLHFVNSERADLKKLIDKIEQIESIDTQEYTQESIQSLNVVLDEAKEMLKLDIITQSQCDEMINKLEKAIENLEKNEDLTQIINIADKYLRDAIKETLKLDSADITIADMYKLTSLEIENEYLRSLDGIEYAKNLELLNINYNELCDISPIKDLKKLKSFSSLENFIMAEETMYARDNKFELDDIKVIDLNGERLLPKEIVLSPRTNPKKLNLQDVLLDGKIIIDAALVQNSDAVEIMYESEHKNFTVYSFFMLKK